MTNFSYSSLPLDEGTTELFAALANERRQCIVQILSETEGSVALADLAHDIAAMETEDSGSVAREDVERIHVYLRHIHVPMLCDFDLATYDRDERAVSRTTNTPRARRILLAAAV